ncbi:MAG: hypothetical protein Q9223_006647 [Gallowayella weberi]
MALFTGKVIAITGGASGIGQATAQLLAARGATVSIADVQQEALGATVDSIKRANPDAKILTKLVNVVSLKDVDLWIQETVSHFGKIDGAVNMAGIAGNDKDSFIEDIEEDDFDSLFAVNVKGMFNCLKVQLKAMKENGDGSIVNASSAVALKAYPGAMAYTASKVRTVSSHILVSKMKCTDMICGPQHAVVGMTKTAAVEYADKNIRVNAIAP